MRKTNSDVISFNTIVSCVLRKFREDKELHIIEFAEKSGIPRSIYSKYERGLVPLTLAHLYLVSEFMNKSMVEILGYAESYAYRLHSYGMVIIHGVWDSSTRNSLKPGSVEHHIEDVYNDFCTFYEYDLN